ADSEIGSCRSNFAGVFLERSLDHFGLDVLTRLFERRGGGYNILSSFQLEIFCGYSRSTGHDDASFHAVLKFANIPRPRIAAYCTQCVGGENHPGAAAVLIGI